MVSSRSKGSQFEYRVRNVLRKALDMPVERMLLSGQTQGWDITIKAPNKTYKLELKKATAKKYCSFSIDYLKKLKEGKIDAIIFGLKRTEPFVIVKLDDFVELIKKRTDP